MARVDGGTLIARCLKQEGVEYLHFLGGGHIGPISRACQEAGIETVGYRDERGAAHGAEGYARASGKVGVCAVTAGVGVTNATTGIASARIDNVPMVIFSGRHSTEDDGRGALQEFEAVEMCRSITKWSRLVHAWEAIPFFVQMAFRQALAPTPGPSLIEIPYDVLAAQGEDTGTTILAPERSASWQQGRWGQDYREEGTKVTILPPERYRSEAQALGDPVFIERAVKMLLEAEKPIIVAGDGAFRPNASKEVKELAELLQIPVYTTKQGEGAISEYHPLAVHRVIRSKLTRECDVALSLGVKFWRGEGFGFQAGIWNPNYRLIQVDADRARIGHNPYPEVGIVGDVKSVVAQMTECAREMLKSKAVRDRAAWIEFFEEKKRAFEEEKVKEAEANWKNVPIHPARLCHEVANFLDRDATMILDGLRSAAWFERWVKAEHMGQVLPLNQHGAMGPGVPWAVGAQLARPGKQVLVFEGDLAFGIGGMEMETAARYDLPICVVLYNNHGGPSPYRRTPQQQRASGFQPDLRYDLLAQGLGCYGELVKEPDQIRPALERAFSSGKPALLNVMVDSMATGSLYGGGAAGGSKTRARWW